jgi:phosphoglycolate phosphatase
VTPARTILFDMDGVLVDSRVAIANCVAHAFARHGLPVPPERAVHSHIGPPLHDMFAALLGARADAALVATLVETYRERYRERCIEETPAFPGVAELLDALAARGCRLGVVTSKPTVFAAPILRARELDRHLAVIEGPSLEARSEPKRVTLARALAALGEPEPRMVTMVGDRRHDVEAARAHGIGTIGVLWGIGSREELEQAGAVGIAGDPSEVLALVSV